MRGFQSPLFYLASAPGPIVVAGSAGQRRPAERLCEAMGRLGRPARLADVPAAAKLETLDANLLLIGGLGGEQPEAIQRLQQMAVLGRTDDSFPAAGGFLIQRRVHPFFPDRFLVAVTAADPQGMAAATEKLSAAAAGLQEALARHASCRRAVALVDAGEDTRKVFQQYVLELPLRSRFRGHDDVQTALDPRDFLGDDGQLLPLWQNLGAVVIAARRPLTAGEQALVLGLPAKGVNVIWSAATLQADPRTAEKLGIRLGRLHSVAASAPVEAWARQPLAVPDIGGVALERIEKFSSRKPQSQSWQRGMHVIDLAADEPWRAAGKNSDGLPLVLTRAAGEGSHWVFGHDLAEAAKILYDTTHRGVNHHIYNRDTACGLERVFRLMANAAASLLPQRSAATGRLRASIRGDRQWYSDEQPIRLSVEVRDAEGRLQDAFVRCGFATGSDTTPARWTAAERVAAGRYRLEAPAPPASDGLVPQALAAEGYRQQRLLHVFVEAIKPGWVSDWTVHTVRVGSESDERGRLTELASLIESRQTMAELAVEAREHAVEVHGNLRLSQEHRSDRPMPLELTIRQVESDTGNDWLEEIELLLKSADGKRTVRLPVAPGNFVAAAKASVVRKRPGECVVVDSLHPASFVLQWSQPEPGTWSAWLKYRYTDYYIQKADRLVREDPLTHGSFEVGP